MNTNRPMRVLVLGRLFSGLKDSVQQGRWEPRGVPAFYRLVEGLQADPGCVLTTVLACKEDDRRFPRSTTIHLAQAGRIAVLAWQRPSFGILRRVDWLATELVQIASIVLKALRFRPDVVYATYANLFPAAIMCRVMRRNVVLRLMGIFPHQRSLHRARFALHRWALRSPFRAVVCTEDGSDPASVLPPLLHPESELVLRLNGCDAPIKTDAAVRSEQAFSVLFVGRLEPYKGCDIFVDAALTVLARSAIPVRFVIVGDGTMREELQRRAESAGRPGSIRFTGAIPHRHVVRYLEACDVYVSVNFNGNLSNANLEALAAGACLLIPTSDPAIPIDTSTDRLLPHDAAMRYDRKEPTESLARAVSDLIGNPAKIAAYRASARKCARALLRPWAEQIDSDIALLKKFGAPQHVRGNARQVLVDPNS